MIKTSQRISLFIIDDEPWVLTDVAEELAGSGFFDVMGTFEDLSSAFQAADKLGPPDMVLADIHLSGANGLNVIRLFEGICDFIVFMTAHPTSAAEAFKVYPEGCVFKPVTIEDLLPLVKKFHKRQVKRPLGITGGKLLVYSSKHEDYRPITIDEVLYVEADKGYLSIVTAAEEWLTDMSMSDLHDKLMGTKKFMRISAKHLVAYEKITNINKKVVYVGEKAMIVTGMGLVAFETYFTGAWAGRQKKGKPGNNKDGG